MRSRHWGTLLVLTLVVATTAFVARFYATEQDESYVVYSALLRELMSSGDEPVPKVFILNQTEDSGGQWKVDKASGGRFVMD